MLGVYSSEELAAVAIGVGWRLCGDVRPGGTFAACVTQRRFLCTRGRLIAFVKCRGPGVVVGNGLQKLWSSRPHRIAASTHSKRLGGWAEAHTSRFTASILESQESPPKLCAAVPVSLRC